MAKTVFRVPREVRDALRQHRITTGVSMSFATKKWVEEAVASKESFHDAPRLKDVSRFPAVVAISMPQEALDSLRALCIEQGRWLSEYVTLVLAKRLGVPYDRLAGEAEEESTSWGSEAPQVVFDQAAAVEVG
jgi:hypothetical protein